MRIFFPLLVILPLLALPVEASAQPDAQQSPTEIHNAVAAFVHAQTRSLPGQVTFKIDEIDRRVIRPACPALETFLPPGSQLLGNTMIGVRCPGKKGWTLFVPVHVKVNVDMLIINKPLPQGHVLGPEDLATQNGELAQTGIFTDPTQVLGKVLKYAIAAGQVLRPEMLRAPYAITQGQMVQLKIEGVGFSIRSEGRALNNAAEGETVQVKTASGQMVSGTARPGGVIEILP